ncbi:hypothetical protein [Nannocystis pusilla]|uniref:Integral membrane protein n=1 Tax=Nannocystis pusilla TaxID=889268 RepID=A0ABS7TLB4_9BACT|nr:hypothetical protein [Nannocystis pusilla]MBZ5709012.1 hypothetical protein [Nannocystis pusilla]
MSYELFLILHIVGIVLLFMGLGGLAFHGIAGGTRETNPARGLVAGTHGIGTLLIVIAGFGMLGVKYGGAMPGWVHPKLLVWICLAAAPALVARKPGAGRVLWFVAPLLALVAAYFGLNHK